MTSRFSEKIDGLLATNQLNEAQRWIEAARRIVEVLEGELTLAVDQASRRVELQHRRSYDEQYLTHFLKRDEQIATFNRLLDRKTTKVWALHFVAPGGFGKTMLMRYITAHLIAQRGGSVARVDFDYLNPGYPSRAPALLLDQFTQELRLQGNEQSDKEFDQFSRKMTTFYERFTSGLVGGATMAQTLEDAEFLNLLRTFAKGLSYLPQPVVLILDTCEELAKIRPDGVIPENVHATFQILEQLHRMLPALRVIFSGRRPLARSGAGGWSCPTSTHPRRSYLLLHEVRGFTQAEALIYLRDKMQVRTPLIEPILEKSPDTDKGGLFTYKQRTKQQATSLEPRYNPFDLWLYANWANADSTLTAEALRAADMDRYIEQRIVGRIDHPGLRSLLPAVSLLGHFDRETLREVSPVNDEAFNAIFQELQNQEWIQLQQFTFWKVKSGLRERLYNYYRKHNPVALGEVRRHVTPYLERITQEWPLERLNISHFDVALRLLEETDPLRAAIWWEKIAARFASEPNAYGWAINLIDLLQGEEGAIAEAIDADSRQESALRAAVLATYAAAQLHVTPALTAERRATWQEVANKLERHPTAAGKERLRLRASAALAMLTKDFRPLFQLLATDFQQKLDEQSVASLVAAMESLLEEREPVSQEIFLQESNEELVAPARWEPLDWNPVLAFIDQLDPAQLSAELYTFALTLAARFCKLTRDWSGMERYFLQALTQVHQLHTNLQCWLDWRAPENLDARVRLEYIRAFYPAHHAPQYVLEMVRTDFATPDEKSNIDLDRLQTALLQLHAAQSPPLQVIIEYSLRVNVMSRFIWEPYCNAHRAFQPFFCAMAEEIAKLGRVEQTRDELVLALHTEPIAGNPDAVRSVDHTILRIMRRMRFQNDFFFRPESEYPEYSEKWALDGLNGPQVGPVPLANFSRRISSRLSGYFAMDSERAALLCHARWRTSYTLRLEWAMGALSSQLAPIERRVSPQGNLEEASFAALSLALDALEINAICQNLGIPPFLPTLTVAQFQHIREGWFMAHQDEPVEALTLALRAAALEPSRSEPLQFPDALIQRIGVRSAAQIALDEGELLALRLPEFALPLLDQARFWFAAAQDSLSEFIVTITLALVHARLGNREQLVQLLHSHFGQQYFEQIPDLMSLLLDNEQFYVQYQVPRSSPKESAASRSLLDKLFGRMLKAMPAEQRNIVNLSFGWRPWLIRWLACAAWSIGLGADMQNLEHWLEKNYAVTHPQIATSGATESEKFLPAELDGWPAWPGEQVTLVRHPQPDQPALPQLNEMKSTHITNGAIVLSFTSKDEPSSIRRGGLNITMGVIAPLGDKDSASMIEPAIAPVLVSAFTAYAQSAQRITELKRMLQFLQLTRPNTVELSVDEASSSLCWEGLITLALAEMSLQSSQQIDLQQLHLYRTMPKLPSWPRYTPRIIIEIDAVGNSIDALGLQNSIWDGLIKDDVRPTVRVYDIEHLFPSRQVLNHRKTNVLHLVVPMFETISGQLGIRVGPGSLFETSENLFSGQSGLWHPSELVRSYPYLTFCIIQAPPASLTRRTETDRERAATQRRFAAQLFTGGCPIVLAIPALPPEVGKQVGLCFSETLRNRMVPSLPTLLAALVRARATIIEQGGSWRREDTLEAALDVCLYYAREENESVNN